MTAIRDVPDKNEWWEKINKRYFDNYGSLTDFCTQTGCPLSRETIRRYIYEAYPIAEPSMIILMLSLDFTPREIRQYLESLPISYLKEAISESEESLSTWQRLLIEVAVSMRDDTERWNNLMATAKILFPEYSGVFTRLLHKK